MKRLSVRFDCPSCGFAAPAAIEIPEELSDRWLEVRAAGFQSHLRNGGATGDKVSIQWTDNTGDSRTDEVVLT